MKLFICRILGHKYRLKRHINHNVKELFCTRCKAEFGMHCEKEVIFLLDDDLREAHERFLTAVGIKETLKNNPPRGYDLRQASNFKL
jgi:hypothetical protein